MLFVIWPHQPRVPADIKKQSAETSGTWLANELRERFATVTRRLENKVLSRPEFNGSILQDGSKSNGPYSEAARIIVDIKNENQNAVLNALVSVSGVSAAGPYNGPLPA